MAIALRWLALGLSAIPTALSAWLFVVLARADGWTPLDTLRLVLSTACVFWIAWGAVSGLLGLFARRLERPERAGPSGSRTAILMPIYNEDPPSTFARIAAVS
ncbi:MAG TPA: glucan biosynthesis glucosyltransferase H, partial [Devosia sp.]|nr:glucan biosynthesis glucosyltransferase H [Devosia sp.]